MSHTTQHEEPRIGMAVGSLVMGIGALFLGLLGFLSGSPSGWLLLQLLVGSYAAVFGARQIRREHGGAQACGIIGLSLGTIAALSSVVILSTSEYLP